MTIFEKDLYNILQVSSDANLEVINSAYRTLAEKYHPTSKYADPEKYREINQAFEILCNPITRKEYDQKQLYKIDNSLPVIQPTLNNSVSNLQDLIQLIYENINFESVNHNPTKCRIYQEIYDEIIRKKQSIETTNSIKNPIWKILKTYQAYLPSEEFNSIKLLTAKILQISDKEATSILNNTAITEFASKKTYFIVISLFITCILGVTLAYMFMSKDKTGPETINNVSSSKSLIPPAINNESSIYFARIVNLGIPVNVRSAPTVKWNNVVTKVKPNEMVEVIKHHPNGWYYIKKDSQEGYIYGGLLKDNDYINAYAIVEILPQYLKVYDKDKKILRSIKQGNRFVVLYHDNNHYYIISENSNIIKINKEFTLFENKQKALVPYIDELKKKEVKYFVPKLKQVFIEEPDEPTEENIEANPELTVEEYLENIKAKIINNWEVPAGLKNYECVIIFQLNQDGTVGSIELFKTSGNNDIDESSINAVQDSTPFNPFPKSLQKDLIEIKMNFDDQH